MSKKVNKKQKRKVVKRHDSEANLMHLVTTTAISAREDMYLSFSSGLTGVKRHGLTKVRCRLSNKPRTVKTENGPMVISPAELALSAINIDFNNNKRTWQFWIGLFHEVDGSIECYITSGTVDNVTTLDLTPLMAELTQDELHETVTTDKLKTVPSWGWAITPSTRLDLAGSEEELMQMFVEDQNVMDKVHCTAAYEQAMDELVERLV